MPKGSLPGAKGDFAVTQKQIRHVPEETRRSAVTKLPPPAGRGRSASKVRTNVPLSQWRQWRLTCSGDLHAVETYMQWRLSTNYEREDLHLRERRPALAREKICRDEREDLHLRERRLAFTRERICRGDM